MTADQLCAFLAARGRCTSTFEAKKWADIQHKEAAESVVRAARATTLLAEFAHYNRRMLMALDGYWERYEGYGVGEEAWWTVFERYRAKVEECAERVAELVEED